MDLVGGDFYVEFDFIDKHEFLKGIDNTSVHIQTLIGNRMCTCTHSTWYSEYAKGLMVTEF
jgi:hypothetical protein